MRRRRLRMLARGRGFKEVELALSGLVRAGLDDWSEAELDSLEKLLNMDDLDLWDVICGRKSPPQSVDFQLIEKLKSTIVAGG